MQVLSNFNYVVFTANGGSPDEIPAPGGKILGAGMCSFLLTHCRLNELSHTIYWKILNSILGMSGYVI